MQRYNLQICALAIFVSLLVTLIDAQNVTGPTTALSATTGANVTTNSVTGVTTAATGQITTKNSGNAVSMVGCVTTLTSFLVAMQFSQ